MDLRIGNNGYNQSFHGLLGEDKIVKVDNFITSTKAWHEQEYFPFLKETKDSIKNAIEKNSAEFATTIDLNGFGTQIHNLKINEGKMLPFTESEYKAYRHFKSGTNVTAKVESALVENGLERYLNRGLGSKIRKTMSKLLHR